MDWGDAIVALLGAMVGAGIGVWAALNFERLRAKSEAAIAVVGWSDVLIDRLQHLVEVKRAFFLRQGDYKSSFHRTQELYFELTRRAYAREELVRVGIAFGIGPELSAAAALRDVALGLATEVNQVTDEKGAIVQLAMIEAKIEQMRVTAQALTDNLMRQASLPYQLARIAGTVDEPHEISARGAGYDRR